MEAAARVEPSDYSAGIAQYYYVMEADFPTHLALETGNWAAALALQPLPGSDNPARRTICWAQAVAAGHLKDVEGRNPSSDLRPAARTRPTSSSTPRRTTPSAWAETQAWAAFATGNVSAAISILRPLADHQDKTGKQEVDLPAREMIGDMLRIAGAPCRSANRISNILADRPRATEHPRPCQRDGRATRPCDRRRRTTITKCSTTRPNPQVGTKKRCRCSANDPHLIRGPVWHALSEMQTHAGEGASCHGVDRSRCTRKPGPERIYVFVTPTSLANDSSDFTAARAGDSAAFVRLIRQQPGADLQSGAASDRAS